MVAAGFEWISPNVADYPPEAWSNTISRAERAGIPWIPHGRLASPAAGDTREDALAALARLCEIASDWADVHGVRSAIPNTETEIKTPDLGGLVTPKDVAVALDEHELDDSGVSTESWLYDSTDWTPLTPYAVLLQLYPEDNRFPPEEVPEQLATRVRNARSRGFDHVGVTYQGWRSDPSWFDLTGHAWSVAYADDIGYGNFGRWS